MALAVRLDQLVLDDPVALAVEAERVVLELGEAVLPHLRACSSSGLRPLLSEYRSARPRYSPWISRARSSRPFSSRTRRVQVMSWLISRMARMGFSRVMSRRTTPGSSSMRSRMLVAPTLRKVAYSLMFESPTITCRRRNRSASAWGSSRVLMIGRSGSWPRHALPDVLGPLADAVHRAPGGLEHLARAGVDLAGDEERDEDLGVVAEVVAAACEVVLVAAVAVAGRVGVVLEQVDDAADALLAQPLLGEGQQVLEDALPGLVVGDQVEHGVAFGGGVLGMAADVEVEAGAVLEEHVAAPAQDTTRRNR